MTDEAAANQKAHTIGFCPIRIPQLDEELLTDNDAADGLEVELGRHPLQAPVRVEPMPIKAKLAPPVGPTGNEEGRRRRCPLSPIRCAGVWPGQPRGSNRQSSKFWCSCGSSAQPLHDCCHDFWVFQAGQQGISQVVALEAAALLAKLDIGFIEGI